MASLKSLAAWSLSLTIILLLAGCGTFKPEAKSWSLPKKIDANSGMIIGRLDFPDNKTENPEHIVLNLDSLDFKNKAKAITWNGHGEDHYIMDNNYFVVSDLKPGHYRLSSFLAGFVHNVSDVEEFQDIEVKPGQIKFIGSLDYIKYQQSFLQKVGKNFTYSLRKAQHPTELEMLQWLNRVGKGSGWESAIRKRIQELGGQS